MRYVLNEGAIRDEIERTPWDTESGLSPEELRAEARRLEEAEHDLPLTVRKADLFALILDKAEIAVSPEDIFCDRIRHDGILPEIEWKWRAAARKGEAAKILSETDEGVAAKAWDGYSDFSHSCPDWRRILRLGLSGILRELEEARSREGLTPKQETFYTASVTAIKAMRRFADRLAKETERFSDSLYAAKAGELLRAVRDRAPRTLAEALQLILLVYMTQTEIEGTLVRNLGRFDRDLLPFYRHDFENGVSEDETRDVIRHFYMRFTVMNHPNNVPLCLGGALGEGPGGINEFSELLASTYAEMNIYCPKIQIRVTKDTPRAFLVKVLEEIRRGNSSYVLLNDDAVIEGLSLLGADPADAADYIPVGCYEPCVEGKELACTTAGTVSLAKAVELTLFGGTDPVTGKTIGKNVGTEWNTPEEFRHAVEEELRFMAGETLRRVRACESIYPMEHPAPLYSAWIESCVARGTDAYAGGMTYNNTSVNFIGSASAVDAVLAAEKLVLTEKRVTWDGLREMLRADWQGFEQERMYALRRCPKYGNGDPEADALAERLGNAAAASVNGVPNARGGVFRAGFFSIDWIYSWGEKTGALPDGRKAGEPLSKNLSAVIGMDMQGPTSLARCAAKIPAERGVNGSILDVLLHTSACRGDVGMRAMENLVRGYFAQGGQGIQMNIMNAETLRAAQADPESYRSLQVRVCGWNAYFVNLSLVEQNDFIRTAECAGA